MLAAIFALPPLSRVGNNMLANVCSSYILRHEVSGEIFVLIVEYDPKLNTDLACEIMPFFSIFLGYKPIILKKVNST